MLLFHLCDSCTGSALMTLINFLSRVRCLYVRARLVLFIQEFCWETQNFFLLSICSSYYYGFAFFFSQHMLMRPLRWALWSVLVNLLKRRKVVEKMSFIEDMEHFNSLQRDRECTKYSRAYVLGQSN